MSADCTCSECVDACRKQPGWFMPGEAEKAAELLGMTFDDFRSKYLIREYWCGEPQIYLWAPRKVGIDIGLSTAGWSSGFKQSPCVFLDENDRCRIHAAKPHECRIVMCCDHSDDSYAQRPRETIKNEWEKVGNPLNNEGTEST